MSYELIIQIVVAYVCGSIMGGPLLGRLRGGVNLRNSGSGNVGATNALRSQGVAFALAVLIIDMGKGVLAVWLVPKLSIPLVALSEPLMWAPYLCGAAAVLGHVLPIFSRFKGGKGAATLAGAVLVLVPELFAALTVIYVLVLVMSGYASLSLLVATSAFPVAVFLLGLEPAWPLSAFAMFIAALMGLTHRENLHRLRIGKEPRFERVMLWHTKP